VESGCKNVDLQNGRRVISSDHLLDHLWGGGVLGGGRAKAILIS